MSLYNMLFGEGNDADFLLKLLGKDRDDFGRFRSVYVTEDHIVVHTRCGGGNRDDYEAVFDEMSMHPLYSHDADDDFDCTYADIHFKHPAEYSELLKEMSVGTVTPAEKWKMLFENLEKNNA
jgi:hypothetical protein